MSSATQSRVTGPFLDRVTLIEAAADLADVVGWNDLTLSRVAEAVDRHVSSLYSHVDGLDALRREVARLANAQLRDDAEAQVGNGPGVSPVESSPSASGKP